MSTDRKPTTLRVIDSHTGGEPTRVVVDGLPPLGAGDMAARCKELRQSADWVRTSLVTEPRGSEWMVGAALQQPVSPTAVAGTVFFNNVGYIGMCGHGLIGLVATLDYLGRLEAGAHVIETTVGKVTAHLEADRAVSFRNVVSFRRQKDVSIDVPGVGNVVGEVAWGGNWFFIAPFQRRFSLADAEELTDRARRIRSSLETAGITGDGGATIDHIELVGPPGDPDRADARSFVLCPGGHYDRSPCGTGTSAKLACLAAEGKLSPGRTWRQESICGSLFEGCYQTAPEGILPVIKGRAFVNADVQVIIDPCDPFRHGMVASSNGAGTEGPHE